MAVRCETFECEPKYLIEVDSRRKVKHEGRVVRLLDSWLWSTGPNIVGDDSLLPVDGGRR